MKVIGTSGHIDHGKSTLVHRLTGVDPDRLAEEKRRGMTIDLGFAPLLLPSGAQASIVDVPGHERFIKNMLAGAGGVDVALLVVAADEGVMPQTREHVGILHLLGVRHGITALTKSDLVDGDWIDLVQSEVRDILTGTTLSQSAIFPVSAATGTGITELVAALDRKVSETPKREGLVVSFVPVDRVFTVDGFGTVVTGTLHGGSLRADEDLQLLPSGKRVRVRGLQMHGTPVDIAEPGSRVALNLAGVTRNEARRGDVLALPGTVPVVRRFDARLTVLSDAAMPLRQGIRVALHIGAAEHQAVLSILTGDEMAPGDSGWAQLRVDSAIPVVAGQRFILRLPAPARTVAGGVVVDIAPRHRRQDARATSRLDHLTFGNPSEMILAALTDGTIRTLPAISMTTRLSTDAAQMELHALTQSGEVVSLDGFYKSVESWARLRDEVDNVLRRFHHSHPLRRGMPKEELRSRLALSPQVWPAVLRRLGAIGTVQDLPTEVAVAGHQGGSAARLQEAQDILTLLNRDRLSPPIGRDLFSRADRALLAALVDEGEVVQTGEDIFFTRDAYRHICRTTVNLIRQGDGASVAQVRDALGTSRKYVLAALEHMDAERITRRQGDLRVLGPRGDTCA